MRYNKNSVFEKPPAQCPERCGECEFFRPEKKWIGFNGEENWSGICVANGCFRSTESYVRPKDCCNFDSNCYWWYINSIWKKTKEGKWDSYLESRLCSIVFWRVRDTLTRTEIRDLVQHIHRPGGMGIIDFKLYPALKPVYEAVIKENGHE